MGIMLSVSGGMLSVSGKGVGVSGCDGTGRDSGLGVTRQHRPASGFWAWSGARVNPGTVLRWGRAG